MQDFGFSSAGAGASSNQTIVKISIDQTAILNMGTNPIVLLGDPGVDKYYNILNIVFEYSFNSSPYIFPISFHMTLYGCYRASVSRKLITSSTNQYALVNSSVQIDGTQTSFYQVELNNPIFTSLSLTTDNGDNPTAGDGTLLAIITYEIRTFGA